MTTRPQIATLAQVKAAFRAARSTEFSHARSRRWCGSWITNLYVRDATSPSGVRSAAALDDAVANEILKRCGHTSPLSPTEGL